MQSHDPPILYDLGSDPGERYPLKPEDHGDLIMEAKVLMKQARTTVKWAESEIDKGKDERVEPCCSGKCSPMPKCCDCPHESMPQFVTLE